MQGSLPRPMAAASKCVGFVLCLQQDRHGLLKDRLDEIVRIRGQEAIEIVGGELVRYLANALPLRHVDAGEKQQRF